MRGGLRGGWGWGVGGLRAVGFTLMAPLRWLGRRAGGGEARAAGAHGGTVHLKVTGRGGVPATAVSAVVLNVTVTAPAGAGYVSVYGDGTTRPTASNLNFVKGQTVPNLVIAPVGANGQVALYNGSGGGVQLIADVSGYFLSGAPSLAGAFGALVPSRVLDTRSGIGSASAAVAPGGTVHLQLTGRGGVPAAGPISAVVCSVTVTAPNGSGYVRVYGAAVAVPAGRRGAVLAGADGLLLPARVRCEVDIGRTLLISVDDDLVDELDQLVVRCGSKFVVGLGELGETCIGLAHNLVDRPGAEVLAEELVERSQHGRAHV